MKKTINIFFLIILLSINSFCHEKKSLLSLDMKITDLIEFLGEPDSIKVIPYESKKDYDDIWYIYDSAEICTYRIVQKVSKIRIKSNNFILDVNDKYITCGYKKHEIDALLGQGTLEKKDTKGNEYYYYPSADLSEVDVVYDNSSTAIEIYYAYSEL